MAGQAAPHVSVHEVAIVQALFEQVEAEVRQSGCRGRVSGLDLTIGRLSGVNADSIRFAFELLAPGTILAEAQLRIAEPPAQLVCNACGTRAEIEDLTAQCPGCGGRDLRIEGGRELLLESIEIEEEPSAPGKGPGTEDSVC